MHSTGIYNLERILTLGA